MTQPILELHDIRKAFGKTTALDGVTLTVQPGEFLGLLGPNGAGKTTLIGVLLGLIRPDSGTIRLFGLELEAHRLEILQRINFCSSYTGLPSNLTVQECLTVFSRLYGVPRSRQRIAELLDLLEIGHVLPRIFGQLSSGESTRVHLVKALLNRPDLLLLDEPTASLDPDIAAKVRQLLPRIQREEKITIIQTSHNMRDIEELCQRVVFLHQGKILADGSPSELPSRLGESNLEQLFIRLARGLSPASSSP